MADGVADPLPGQPVDLGEGATGEDVVVAHRQRDGGGPIERRDVLAVGLVDRSSPDPLPSRSAVPRRSRGVGPGGGCSVAVVDDVGVASRTAAIMASVSRRHWSRAAPAGSGADVAAAMPGTARTTDRRRPPRFRDRWRPGTTEVSRGGAARRHPDELRIDIVRDRPGPGPAPRASVLG